MDREQPTTAELRDIARKRLMAGRIAATRQMLNEKRKDQPDD